MKPNAEKPSKNQVKGRNGGTLSPQEKGKPSHNPNGRPKGSKNRSTILAQIFESVITSRNPLTKKEEKMSVETAMAYSMIDQVIRKGNVTAWNSAKDDVYGKTKELVEHSGEINTDPRKQLTKKELEKEIERMGLSGKIFDK